MIIKRITHVIISILVLCFLAAAVSGCGGEDTDYGKRAEGEKPAAESVPEAEMFVGGEKNYAELQEELRPSVLQVFCGDYRGSGVVWEITEEEVTVLSSAHLLKNGDTCDVLCYAGVYYEAEVGRILEGCDAGFAVFPAEDLKEDGVTLTAVVPCGRNSGELVRGEELVVYGSMDSVAGNFVKGYLIEAEREMQPEGYDSAQPLLLGGIVREKGSSGETEPDGGERGAVDAGMSGSGVFDRQGNLLGILAGGDGGSGFAAVPVWRIAE